MRCHNAGFTLGRCRRGWANIKTTLGECIMFVPGWLLLHVTHWLYVMTDHGLRNKVDRTSFQPSRYSSTHYLLYSMWTKAIVFTMSHTKVSIVNRIIFI